MQVVRINRFDDLSALAVDWNQLAQDVPFRTWTWLETWWRHYGRPAGAESRAQERFVLAVFDAAGALAAVAPWYVQQARVQGRVIRQLGGGEVCSDYLGIPCRPGAEEAVSAALASWLTDSASNSRLSGLHDDHWDLLRLSQVDPEDAVLHALMQRLQEQGHAIHSSPAEYCWRLTFPATWEDYLASLSKSHRKQIRRLERSHLETGRALVHQVDRAEELPRALDILIELHQLRRYSLGEPGSFASSRFTAFHRDVAPQLLESGRLRLFWMELDGKPAAAEYHFGGTKVVYAYSAGVDPDLLDEEPGRIIGAATIRHALEQGFEAFDFLRGNEPYKAHWRGEPRPMVNFRVVPPGTGARFRQGLWIAGETAKRWAKRLVAPTPIGREG